jgi:hypothetical protein
MTYRRRASRAATADKAFGREWGAVLPFVDGALFDKERLPNATSPTQGQWVIIVTLL